MTNRVIGKKELLIAGELLTVLRADYGDKIVRGSGYHVRPCVFSVPSTDLPRIRLAHQAVPAQAEMLFDGNSDAFEGIGRIVGLDMCELLAPYREEITFAFTCIQIYWGRERRSLNVVPR